MTIQEAYKLRDEYLAKLVGRFYDDNRPDWEIKDVIVSDKENAAKVYTKMYDENISNEKALSNISIKEDGYDALIIAHQWPWNGGEMVVERVGTYLKLNPIDDFSAAD